MPPQTPNSAPIRIDALAIADHRGGVAAPGSVLLEVDPDDESVTGAFRVLAAGTPAEVDLHAAARSPLLRRLDRMRHVLIPGLVNAHTHLDLTHIGPQPHDPESGFVPWVEMIRAARHTERAAIAATVRAGVELSLAAGTVAIGDIAGAVRGRPCTAAAEAFCDSRIQGVSFLEFFGIGTSVRTGPEFARLALAEVGGLPGPGRIGLQPHAPNTVGLAAYREALTMRRGSGPWFSTHLAETPEERLFIGEARGPQRELLERVGVWEASILEDVGRGRHPVAHLAEILNQQPMLAAHVNDATDEAIAILAGSRATVVYCPHASEYFGAQRHFGPHRYRDMLAAGVRVALGTDSIVNLPVGDGLSVLEEMRLLHRRDGTRPEVLLGMATVHGAAGVLGSMDGFTFATGRSGQPGRLLGVLAIDTQEFSEPITRENCLAGVLRTRRGPEVLLARRLDAMIDR